MTIFKEIQKERELQDQKWGPRRRHDPFIWLSILGEEVGEANKAWLEAVYGGRNKKDYRDELIQVAAVAVAMIESLDNRFEEES